MHTVATTTLDQFREAIRAPRNLFLDDWLTNGGQVMGILCLANPLEIVTAAGLLPYRLRGCQTATGAHASNVLLSQQVCSFVRNTVDTLLADDYDFLVGLLPYPCQQLGRAIELVQHKKGFAFHHSIIIPRRKTADYFAFYLDELKTLIQRLEDHFGLKITDADLEEAIQLHNSIRGKMMRLYRLRQMTNSPITGTEAQIVNQAALALPPAIFDEMLGDLLNDLVNAPGVGPYRARVAISGGELEGLSFLEQVEGMGALSVVELTCFGWYFYDRQIPDGPGAPLERLAHAYYYREPRERAEIIKDFQVDGVIIQRLKFCDSFAISQQNQARILQQQGIPVLCLERDFQVSASGQNQTRVQAFMEKIGK